VAYACFSANYLVNVDEGPQLKFMLPPSFASSGVDYELAIAQNGQWTDGYGGPGTIVASATSPTVSIAGRFGFAIPANGRVCTALFVRSTNASTPVPETPAPVTSPGPAGPPGPAGSPGPTAAPAQGGFSLAATSKVNGLTIDTHGNLWVLYADSVTGNFAVDKFAPGSITATPRQYSTPAPELDAQLALGNQPPLGLAVDTSGNVFVGGSPSYYDDVYAFAAPVANGASAASTYAIGFTTTAPDQIAVDASGLVYTTVRASPAAINSMTYAAGTFTTDAFITGSAIVSPVAIVNDSAGNIFELDSDGSDVRLNALASGTVTRTAQLPLSVTASQLAHDPATDYTYVLSDDGAEALNVYAPFSGTNTTLLPMATLYLSQKAFNVSGIAVDANFVYVPSANNVTIYPKYDPTKPYAAWRSRRQNMSIKRGPVY
jgi:sugar lactone lactonase YvrE